jgi:hypothetical protein
VIRFSIPMTMPTPNTLLRMHWAKRRRLQRRVSELVWCALRQAGIGRADPIDRCRMSLTRYSRRRCDVDALGGTAKLLLDVLQPPSRRHPEGLGVIVDDSPDCVIEFHVEHACGAHRTDVLIERA